jgi:16S rRNA A1518/A1519 N6-dimethyltransferase RsmA/KsgA/DIM1 with predicted DNA glycosylase/AP lyase activity
MLVKLLKQDWPAEVLEPALRAAGLGSQVRAEAVALEQFVRLAEALATTSSK